MKDSLVYLLVLMLSLSGLVMERHMPSKVNLPNDLNLHIICRVRKIIIYLSLILLINFPTHTILTCLLFVEGKITSANQKQI